MATIQIKVPNWLDRIFAWPVVMYRKIKYGCAFRRIPLGDGIWTIVDPEDYYRFGCFRWGIMGNSSKIYAARSFRDKNGKIRIVALHKEIMKPGKGRVVDHKNGDSLDNRSANLRSATHAQNVYNCRKRKDATSEYLGVSFDKRNKNWKVQLQHKGKGIYIGRFEDQAEAARAYDSAALKYRGRFARLNFPPKKMIAHCLPGRVFGLAD